jgi:hypothetical protein
MWFDKAETRLRHRRHIAKRHHARHPLVLERLEDRCLLSQFKLGALVQVAPVDPFAGSAIGNVEDVDFVGTQVEPRLAADPTNPNHLAGVWQQDRYTGGLAQGIVAGVSVNGGQTWSEVVVPGLTTASGGSFDVASDPWIAFGPTGSLYVASLLAKVDNRGKEQKSAVAVSKSTDGGLTWNAPTLLIQTISSVIFNDKESITADPHNPARVYVAWDQVNPVAASATQTFFAGSTDVGQTWSAPQVIFQSPTSETNIDHQLLVLPDGTLIDAFAELSAAGFGVPPGSLEILRSADHGATWSSPIVAAQEMPAGTSDPFNREGVRGGDILPEVAADPTNGNLYAVWQDSRFSPFNPVVETGQYDSIAFSMSSDGGLTWSSPMAINQTPANLSAPLDSQAFNPSIAVGANGSVAVTYYDFRYQGSIPGAATDTWAVFGNPLGVGGLTNPANWGNELRLTSASFNLLNAPLSGGWFLGDYQGLAASGSGFDAFFSQAGSNFPQASVFSRQLLRGPAGPPAPAPPSTPVPTVVSLSPTQPPPPTGFLAPAAYPVDQAPDAMAVGDFTNNGITDLVVANSASSTVSVLLGNGDGTFQPELKSAVGKGPRSVAVGDFDGDGTLDIVTANQNDLSVLLGTGKGSFTGAYTFALPNVIGNQIPQIPLAVAVGDVNHDGKLDLVVAAVAELNGSKGFLDVLLGQGDGSFKVGSITPINASFGFLPVGITLADFNRDGNLDVVIANPTSDGGDPGGSSISVLLGNGDGTFRETSDPNVGGTIITSIAVGDFNNDHIPDLVVNASLGVPVTGGVEFVSVVSVLLGNGNGTFQTPQLLVPGSDFNQVVVGDFSHDGNQDIATANSGGTVNVFLGNGNGTFQAPLTFPSGANNPNALAVGDFNRDGFPDLAFVDANTNSVAVLLNSGTWPAPAAASAGLVALPSTTASANPLDAPRTHAEIQSGTTKLLPDAVVLDRLFAPYAGWLPSAHPSRRLRAAIDAWHPALPADNRVLEPWAS